MAAIIKTFQIILAMVIICCNNECQCIPKDLEREAYVQQFLPLTQPEVYKQYKEFAYELLQNQQFGQSHQGQLILNPFSIGHALAVVNENAVLNISSAGIEDVLKIGCYKITAAYKDLINALTENKSATKITSTIYTKQEDIYLSPGLGKLRTFVNLVDVNDPKMSVEYINTEIHKKLKQNIPLPFFQTMLPAEQLSGDYLVNTFEYQTTWPQKWTQIDEPTKFYSLNKTVEVPFMITEGNYELFAKGNKVLIKIPLESEKKNLILIKSNMHLVHLLKSGKGYEDWVGIINKLWNEFVITAKDIRGADYEWAKRFMTIQIPVLKQLVGISTHDRLKQLGLQTLCPTSGSTTNSPTDFLQQFGQLTSVNFNPEELSLASITGAKNIGQGPTSTSKNSRKKRSPYPEEPEAAIASDNENQSIIPKQQQSGAVGDLVEPFNIIFDQPFFWVLEDNQVGPVFAGGVLEPFSGETKLSEDFMKEYLVCT